ncbi:hypothetical protein CEP52_011362 [Fusarium oligoseptatum]|uniref:Uncharacterized protein n=1 Tax=Fusarium oligoseptatum TaxID=2604345 RepID=A0A428T3J9_9HYPO|nr:hypothetical protein CEP52_011362 [Fusarium oligoseptatum]
MPVIVWAIATTGDLTATRAWVEARDGSDSDGQQRSGSGSNSNLLSDVGFARGNLLCLAGVVIQNQAWGAVSAPETDPDRTGPDEESPREEEGIGTAAAASEAISGTRF